MLNWQFYKDPFLTTYETNIITGEQKDGRWHYVLENTIFYPTGGGQPHDTGFLNNQPVLDVYADEGTIFHVVLREIAQHEIAQQKVTCKLNWDRRLYHMQHHTGQHLLSAVFQRLYDYATKGFHLGEDYTTIDITAQQLSDQQIQAVETEVNQIIYESLPIQAYFVTKQELAKLPVRKAPQVEEDIRIVEIEKLDYSPCGGTHLANTGQIGLIKIIKTEKYKDMTRVYFLCGGKALEDYVDKHNIATSLTNLLSTSILELPSRVETELARKKELESQVKTLQEQLLAYRATELIETAENGVINVDLDDGTMDTAQYLARHLMSLGQYTILIRVENKLLLAHNTDTDLHCGTIIREHGAKFGGRGGGSPQMAQAFFPDPCQLEEFRAFLITQLL